MKTIDEIRKKVAIAAPKYKVKTVRLFGSYADGRATNSSDVDLLVEYQEDPVSAFKVMGFREEMQKSLGLQVDVLQVPIEKVLYRGFRINREVPLYGY